MSFPPTPPNQPSFDRPFPQPGGAFPYSGDLRSAQRAYPEPPRPPRFWQIFIKDVCTTVIGVTLFCVLCFFFMGCLVYVAASALGGALSADLGTSVGTETVISGDDSAPHRVVVLPIVGEIETEEDGFIATAIKELEEDDKLAAVVLRIDSPGGTISGSDYYHHLLTELKKKKNVPIVVSMGDLTASGGYYISMVGDKLFAERSTTTGSIGVIIPMYNAAALCEKLGVRSAAITSGAMKGMGNFTKEPTPEEIAIWQSLVDDGYEQFLDVVRAGRPYFQDEDKDAELREIADGRVYTAPQALEKHLIDEIGFLSDAIDAAIELAGLDKNEVQVVRFDEEPDFLSSLGLTMKSEKAKLNKAVDAVAVPRAYYLCPRALPL
ncbi:MAG: signal peptide peptidase SppA [Thermoguttaceae bacterium]|nr:signal peptide peptidase SppA [Thermoguttaceae bacterium]